MKEEEKQQLPQAETVGVGEQPRTWCLNPQTTSAQRHLFKKPCHWRYSQLKQARTRNVDHIAIFMIQVQVQSTVLSGAQYKCHMTLLCIQDTTSMYEVPATSFR
jgi:hypothetical protein